MKEGFVDLLYVLSDKTIAGNVRWEETPHEEMFLIVFDSGMVRIGESDEYEWDDEINDHVRRRFYTAWLLTPSGRVVEEMKRGDGDADYELLRTLYEKARSQSRGSDKLISQLLSELERSGGSRVG